MKDLTVPASFDSKLQLYVSLGLLSKDTLESESFLKQLKQVIEKKVDKLLLDLGKGDSSDKELRENNESDAKPKLGKPVSEYIVFEQDKLKAIEVDLKNKILEDTLFNLRGKIELAGKPKDVNRALIHNPKRTFAGLIVKLQKLVDATQGYYLECYSEASQDKIIYSPAEIEPKYKNLAELSNSLNKLRENFNNSEILENIQPEQLTFKIGDIAGSVKLTKNPYVIETELGKYEKNIGWMSPYLVVHLEFEENENFKSSHIDEHYETFMSNFDGVQCVCLSYSKKVIKSQFIDSDIIHTISNWLNDAGIEVFLHETNSRKKNYDFFGHLTTTTEDKTMMKYMGILRSFGMISSKLKLLLDLEIESISLQDRILDHDLKNIPCPLNKEVDNVILYIEQVMSREMESIIRSYQGDLSNKTSNIKSLIERELKKVYLYKNGEPVNNDEQPTDKWEATYTIKKDIIEEVISLSRNKLNDLLEDISKSLQRSWDSSIELGSDNLPTDIKRKFLLPALQTKSLNECKTGFPANEGFLNEFLEQAILHKEVIVPPVSEEGIKSLVDETCDRFLNESTSKAFTRFTIPKIVDKWLFSVNPLTTLLKILKLSAAMPMRILGPVFAFSGLFMLVGLAAPKKFFQALFGVGESEAFFTPLSLLTMFLVLSFLLGKMRISPRCEIIAA